MDAAQRPGTEPLSLSDGLTTRLDCRADSARALPRSVAIAAAEAAAALEFPLLGPMKATPREKTYGGARSEAAMMMTDKAQDDPDRVQDEAARMVLSLEEQNILLSVLEGTLTTRDGTIVRGSPAEAKEPATTGRKRSAGGGGFASKPSALSAHSPVPSTGTPSGEAPVQKLGRKMKKSRRHRYRRKHEVDALRIKVVELMEQLESLREQEKASTDAPRASGDSSLDSLVTTTKVRAHWKDIASSEREKTQRARAENKRLRAQYEVQLHIIKCYDAMYLSHQVFGEMDPWPEIDVIAKRSRLELVDDDFAIFASLGRDFDAQYSKVDSIFQVAGLADFDGDVMHEMQLRQGSNGIFFIENVLSQVVLQDVFSLDCAIWQFNSSKEALKHHDLFEVRKADNGNVRKIVDTIRLPSAEAILTVRTAMRAYKEETRFVVVWDSVLEVSGPVSMRFRERGWKLKRRPHAKATPDTDPVSVEQICTRITPELRGAYVEKDLAAGTLANLLIASYNQYTKQSYGSKVKYLCRVLV